MTALPVDEHVLAFLRVHMETAAYDAAHSEENGHGPLGRRYSLWASCIDHVELLGSDPAYAAHFADLVMRRTIAAAHRGDPAAEQAALAELGLADHRFTQDAPGAADQGLYPADAVACPRCNALDGYSTADNACLECTYTTAGRLIPRLSAHHTCCWDIRPGRLEIQHCGGETDAQIRADIRRIADAQGLEYVEIDEGPRARAAARGLVDGTAVRIWNYVKPACEHDDEDVPALTQPATSMLPSHIALGELIRDLSGEPISNWDLYADHVKAHYFQMARKGQTRAGLQALAAWLGYEYREPPRHDGALSIKAVGTINGTPIEIWGYDAACEQDQARAEKPSEPEPVEELADWERELLASATDPTPDSAAADKRRAINEAQFDDAEAKYLAGMTTSVEYFDTAEAADVREIEREMAIEAGDDSEIDRQVAEDDARNEARWADAAEIGVDL